MKYRSCAFILLLCTLVANAQLPPELLFSDPFTTSKPEFDINVENNTRQGGRFKPLNYSEISVTTAGGSDDSRSLIINDNNGSRLLFWPRNGGQGFVSLVTASPNHNFIESPRFTIEFDVEPLINDVADSSSDWASVQFGGSANQFPTGASGLTVLFRGNRRLDILPGGGASALFATENPILPAGAFHVKVLAEAVDFDVNEPVTVTVWVNNTQVAKVTRPRGMTANYVSLQAYCAPSLLTDAQGQHISDAQWFTTFDNLFIQAIHCIKVSPYSFNLKKGETSEPIQITVPAALTQNAAATLMIKSSNPTVAEVVGGANGERAITFDRGTTALSFNVKGLKGGECAFVVSNTNGVCVDRSVTVKVNDSILRNTSFEALPNELLGGFAVPSWESTYGVVGIDNGSSGFTDNGVAADGRQIAYLNGPGDISQKIFGLNPQSTYWLQVFYNSSLSGVPPKMIVKFNEQTLATVEEVVPVGADQLYYFQSIPFVPGATEGTLVIVNESSGESGTLLLDSVSLVERNEEQQVLINPSFEASGDISLPAGFLQGALAGWTGSGDYGLDKGGNLFADNGAVPDQEHVLYLQGPAEVEQLLTGLEPGGKYEITLFCNARKTHAPEMEIKIGGATILPTTKITPVGDRNPFHRKTMEFTPALSEEVLKISQVSGQPLVLLIDNLAIVQKSPGVAPKLSIARQGSQVIVSWPQVASGYVLQISRALGSGWENHPEPPAIGQDSFSVSFSSGSAPAFFRLLR